MAVNTTVNQEHREQFLAGYAECLRMLETQFNDTNGYQVLGILQGYYTQQLQLWALADNPKTPYPPPLVARVLES